MYQTRKLTVIGTFIWLLCALFFLYEFLLRTVLGTFEHPITYDLRLNLVKFAVLSSTAYITIYGIMQIPASLITERFGLKRTLFIAALICTVAVVGFGLIHSFHSAFIFRILMGFGSSFGFICLLVAVYDWMPQKNIAFFIGLSQFLGTMGPILAAGPLNALANQSAIDWRYVFLGLGGFGLVISMLVLFFVRNNQDYAGSFLILKRPEPLAKTLRALLWQKQTWLIALFSGSIYFSIEYLSENSGKTFLMLNGYSSNFASYMITVAWVGYAIGCPLLGYVSDAMGKRKPGMIFAALCGLIAALVIIYYPINSTLLTIAFFLLGVGTSGQSIGFAIMAEQCNTTYLAVGLGLNNAVLSMIAAFNAPLIGWVLDLLAKAQSPSVANYQTAFLIIIGFLCLAVVLSLLFIKETFCKSTKTPFKLTVK